MERNLFPLFVLLGLIYFAALPKAQPVTPAPDGGYPGFTTAEGQNALQGLTTGLGNSGVGWYSLFGNSSGNYNTAVGAGALDLNNADSNTAVGAAALLLNTSGTDNVAVGTDALVYNDTGNFNTAIGYQALYHNIIGNDNTAVGDNALLSVDGNDNTAVGFNALINNTSYDNTAVGVNALLNTTNASSNTAIGVNALAGNTTGQQNTALGISAGGNVTTASGVICIGSVGENVDNSCYVGNVFGAVAASGVQVFIDSSDRLGTSTSSKRFKEEIKPMGRASDALYALKPVAFLYKKEIDPRRTQQLGLVAEDVEKVNPDLIVRDKQGKPYSVRYDQVNAMLLNEFLKEHQQVQELKATIAKQQKSFDAALIGLKEQIESVSAQLKLNRPAPQTVLNSP